MDIEEHIAKAQKENQMKFAAQLDLFTAQPEMIKMKESVSNSILIAMQNISNIESELSKYKNDLTNLAIKAIELQDKGIFWDDPNFSVCKAQKRKDEKAMFAQIEDSKLMIYENLKKQTKAVKASLFKTIKPIYLATNPSIKRHGEKEYDEVEEE